MTEGQWYYTQNGQQAGPVSFYQLQQLANSGKLHGTDYVWTEGQGDWKPADQVAGLFSGAARPGGNDTSPPSPPPSGSDDMVLPHNPPRDPTVMAILSLVVPGLGQMVLGQTVKGIVLFVLFLGVGLSTWCFGGVAVAIVAIIDAYQIATKLKRGQAVGQWDFF